METYDVAGLVAALSYPIVSEAGLPDAPADQRGMHATVAAWIETGDEAGPRPQIRHLQGVGYGLDTITCLDLARIVLDALVATSLHLGLVHTIEALKGRHSRRPIPKPDLDTLISEATVLRSELQRRLGELGLDDEQAHALADSAVSIACGRKD